MYTYLNILKIKYIHIKLFKILYINIMYLSFAWVDQPLYQT